MIPLSPWLDWTEVLRGSGVARPDDLPPEIVKNIRLMADTLFEPLRKAWRGPLNVVSGYRTRAANAAAKGKPRSWHMTGLALDLVPGAGRERCFDLYDIAATMQREGDLPKGGLGLYLRADGSPRFLHVDCRGRRARFDVKDPETGRWVTRRAQLPEVA